MKFSSRQILIFSLILAGVIALAVISAVGIGKAYRAGLSRYTQDYGQGDVTHVEREKITKIRLRKGDDTGCIELTPDGAVRIYKDCGKEELQDAYRENDTRNILRLFKQMSELDYAKIKEADVCNTYLLTITAGSTTRTVCISDIESGSGSGSGGGGSGGQTVTDITQTIGTIISDIPEPTPTGILPQISPTDYLLPGISPTVIPTQSDFPWITPEPTPTEGPVKPFTCDFYDYPGTKKPYRVSSVVCSTVPQAGQ
jgi:hypothetical protein